MSHHRKWTVTRRDLADSLSLTRSPVQYRSGSVAWRAGYSRSSAHRPWQESNNRFRRRHSTAQYSVTTPAFSKVIFLVRLHCFLHTWRRDTLPAVQTSTESHLLLPSIYSTWTMLCALIKLILLPRTSHLTRILAKVISYKEFSLQIILKSKSYKILTIFI